MLGAETRRIGRSSRGAAYLGLAVILLVASPGWALAQGAKPFYEGKTIQLVAPTGPGGTTDITARLVSRYLGKHIPGNPAIIVQNMPGAGGLVAANHLFQIAKPDGLTITAVLRANYLDQMVERPEVKFDFRKFSWIGSFNKAPMMAACRTDTPYKSIAAIRAAKVPPRFGQAGTGSVSYIFGKLMEKILDLKVKNVTGYPGSRETDLGWERGEIDCRATSDITVLRSPWRQWVKDNFVTFIIQQGPEKSNLLPPVPTVYELAPAAAKPTLDLMTVMLAYTEFDRPFATSPGVPTERLQILRESFERMLKDPDFAAEARKHLDWDGTTFLSGEDLRKKIEATVTQPPDLVKRVKEILGDS